MPVEGKGTLMELVGAAIELAADLLGTNISSGAGSSTAPRRGTPKRVERTIDGIRTVIVDSLQRDNARNMLVTELRVGSNLELSADLNIRAGATTRSFGDFETGDSSFDGAATVTGPEIAMTTALTHQVRDTLGPWLIEIGGAIEGGVLTYEEFDLTDRERLPDLIAAMVNIAKLLRGPPAERLKNIATDDPVPRMRLRALVLLLERYRDSEQTRDALATAELDMDRLGAEATDGDQMIDRLLAIRALGAVGRVTEVERLLPLTSGIFTSTAITTAADAAIASIQSRVGRDHDGALSLTESDGPEGALSLTEAGGLSLTDQE